VRSSFLGENWGKLGLFVKIEWIWKYVIIGDRIQETGDRMKDDNRLCGQKLKMND